MRGGYLEVFKIFRGFDNIGTGDYFNAGRSKYEDRTASIKKIKKTETKSIPSFSVGSVMLATFYLLKSSIAQQ